LKAKKILLICIGVMILIMMAGCENKAANGGIVIIELYPEFAPKTVENFVKLVESGFYDGVIFHRIVDGFMAQGGDPDGTGTGGSSEKIEGEFSSNGFTQNTLSHTKGVISMARSGHPDSASSQFFIMLADNKFLDGDYAAFGKVTEGMDVILSFEKLERSMNSFGEMAIPVKPVVMKKVTIISSDGNPKVQMEIEIKD
jgi:cyclophilin family peptidyl-prolyl cis-trans isomerase